MRTLVIGIGTAGVNVLNTLHDKMVNDLIERQEDEKKHGEIVREVDDIHFFAIESSTAESAHDIAESKSFRHTKSYKYYLLNAPSTFNLDIQDHIYLLPDLDVSGQGAKRNRVISRYFVDSTDEFARNDKLFSKLDDELTYLYEANSNSARIWIIHSLSGGTGSGLFPLISMYLKKKFHDYQATNTEFNLFTCGIGFYSKLQNNSTGNMLKGEERLYSNSFAAMRELNKLLWPDSPHISTSPTLTLYSEQNDNDRTIELERKGKIFPAFDKYFLVGVDEKKALDKTYLNRINNMSAECLRSILFQDENLGLLDRDDKGRLGSFNEREVRINYEGLKEYFGLQDEIHKDKVKCKALNQSYDKDNELFEKLYKKYYEKPFTGKSDYERYEDILSLKSILSQRLGETAGIISSIFGDKKTLKKQISQLEKLANLESTKKEIDVNKSKAQALLDKFTKFEESDGCITIPFNKEIVKEPEILEKLSVEENNNSIKYLIENGYINKEHLVSSTNKQYELSKRKLERFVRDKFRTDLHGHEPIEKTFLLNNNPDLVNEGNNSTVDVNYVNWVDPYTLKYVTFNTGLNFKGLSFYIEMQNVYRSGTLSKYDNRFLLTENGGGIGRIFAYPEFFVNDPRVMCAYPKYLEAGIGELNWEKYWEDWTNDRNILERGIMKKYLPDADVHEE